MVSSAVDGLVPGIASPHAALVHACTHTRTCGHTHIHTHTQHNTQHTHTQFRGLGVCAGTPHASRGVSELRKVRSMEQPEQLGRLQASTGCWPMVLIG